MTQQTCTAPEQQQQERERPVPGAIPQEREAMLALVLRNTRRQRGS